MIISCPSCATRYDMPADRMAGEGAMIRCAACGTSWLEARAIEIAHTSPRQLPAVIDHGDEPEQEVRRLVEASREAEEDFARKLRLKRRRRASWAAFAAAALSPLVLAWAYPETVVRLAPATVALYGALGRDVNIYGLEVRNVEMQHIVSDGTRVLTVKGEIANVTAGERKIPSLRFGLRNDQGAEVYEWTVDSTARPLRGGESTTFVTRVAAPPETARNVEIRFAHADEIGSNTRHE
jgi:predicted Zn finger-like uncharacterized protein